MSRFIAVALTLALVATLTRADELKLEHVTSKVGDGPDGKGNTNDDTWQFWFELVHKPGHYQPLDTHSTSVPKKGVPRKITGPIASLLPSPDDSEGWIFHRDWDGRFEGVWGDRKAKHILAYPYVEKKDHRAVAITYRIPKEGNYDISGGVTDLQVQPQFQQHDGIDWFVDVTDGGTPGRRVGKGGPVGDGNGRPDSDRFTLKNVAATKGQLVRLVIHPRQWWGSDLTRIDRFKIEPSQSQP